MIRHPLARWRLVRLSFGMNGWLLKCSDLPAIIEHLAKSRDQFGIDWFLTDAFPLDQQYVYRHNLFEHATAAPSTVWAEDMSFRDKFLAPCHQYLHTSGMNVFNEHAHFDVSMCHEWDLYPCNTGLARLWSFLQPINPALAAAAADDMAVEKAILASYPTLRRVLGIPGETCRASCAAMDLR